MEEEEEIFTTTVVEVHRKRKKRTTLKKPSSRRFDGDYFQFSDHQEYSYENSGQYHDHDYNEYPSRNDPYKAPDPHHDHYVHHDDFDQHDHYDLHSASAYSSLATLYRDVTYYPRRPVIRNPRDSRFFPGNEPAGVLGVSPRLIAFIESRVNSIAFIVQGPPERKLRRKFQHP